MRLYWDIKPWAAGASAGQIIGHTRPTAKAIDTLGFWSSQKYISK
jgi:hypothetical protein